MVSTPSQSQSQGKMVKLDFPEKLIQTGKKENTEALLKRIKTLHGKLAILEQDYTDTRSLDPVRKPLINQTILHHKDRGVKAFAACCLADLLRLYAPDAPYTETELRDIFQFLSTQLSLNLRTAPPVKPLQPSRSKTNDASQTQLSQASQRITDVPYYTEYCYLLESLSTIKSVVLACDVPGGDELVQGFFENFVEIVRSDMSKNIIRHLMSILVALVDEASTVPAGVLDCIISQFETYGSKPETPSFQLIVDVCNRTPERLQRPFYAHMAEIQLKHGKDPDQADLKVLTESHALLLTMYRHCPGLLLSVVPLLEENLRAADEVPLRQLSTRTLGTMFGERPVVGTGVADIATAYPSAWRAWLGRKVDKALPVRLAWVEASKGILVNHPELRKELETDLVDRIHDSDEKIRAAICKTIGSLDYETALHHVSVQTLTALGGRMSDKKMSVRHEAAAALAKLWTSAYSEIEANDAEAIAHFAWIPEAMLECMLKKDAPVELRSQITSTFKTLVLPLPAKPDDEQAWVDRLLLVASHLDDVGFRALERLTGLKGFSRGSSPYRAFIQFCEDNNGGVIDENEKMVKARLNFVINAMANQLFVDSDKATKDMEAFAAANEARLYKLFKTCADPQTDLRTLVKARNELLRRLEQSHTDILDTFTTLIDSASWMIVNHSSIPPLIKVLQKPPSGNHDSNIADAAGKLMSLIAKECPPMFKSHVPELVIVMSNKNDRLSEVALQALAAVCKMEPESAPDERRTVDRAMQVALEGTPRQAKFASRFIANSKHKEACSELIESILNRFDDVEVERLPTYLRALAELALSAVQAFEAKSEEIIRFVMKQVMYKKSPSADEPDTDMWVDESELAPLDKAKLIGMRICTHRSLGFARDEDAVQTVQPTLNLLTSIIESEGLVNTTSQEGGHTRIHMRYRAVLCMMKLANVRVFDKKIAGRTFESMCMAMQDVCWGVRNRLLLKLGEILPGQRLSPRWNILPILVALDPEKETVALAKSIVNSVVRQCTTFSTDQRIDRVELPMARLLLVLSRHPDIADEWDVEGMKNMARYIEFFLDCVATRDNVGLLYHIAGKVKSVRDSTRDDEAKNKVTPKKGESEATKRDVAEAVQEANTNLYRLSELAQHIIRNRAEVYHWAVTTYPGKIKLPRDIFNNLTDSTEVLRNARTTFLGDEYLALAKSLGKRPNHLANPTRRPAERGSSPVKKRSKASSRTPKSKRRVKDSDEDDTDDDDSGEESEGGAISAAVSEAEAEEEGEVTLGRGGRRGAKTKAKKAVSGKEKRKVKKARRSDDMEVDEQESDLTDLEDQ